MHKTRSPFVPESAKEMAIGREVLHWFEQFENINKPERYAEKKKVKNKIFKGNMKMFMEQMDILLKGAMQLLRGKNMRWAEIFYWRMRMRKDLLGAERCSKYEEMIRLYLKKENGTGGSTVSKATPSSMSIPAGAGSCILTLNEAATSLEAFLSTHKLDPDSSLVGLVPAAQVLGRFTYRLENPTIPIGEIEAETTKEALIRSITAWAKLDDPGRVIEEVQRVASLLETVPPTDPARLKVGELLVVGGTAAGTVYGRFSGRRETSAGGGPGLVGVWITPDEKTEELLPANRVFAFTSEMAASLQGGASTMRALVEDPTRGLTMTLNGAIKGRTMRFLTTEIGIDLSLLEKAQRMEVTILDLPKLKEEQSLLLSFLARPPEDFLRAIDDFAQGEVCSFIAALGPRDLFHPTHDEQLRLLQAVQWAELPALRVQRLLSYHKEALTHLQLQKKELMNGTTKDKTTAWWLSLIRSECEKFLARKGYNFRAVPEDYLETPPSDFNAVRQNLLLIREILNPHEDKHQVQRLIKRLKDTIYPEIDRFVSNAHIVLAEQLGMDYKDFVLEEAEARFLVEKDHLDNEVVNWIADMFQDIRYLQRMKLLEIPQEGQEKVLDIVPVTGLIVGRFYRIENELRTVIDHWGSQFPDDLMDASDATEKQLGDEEGEAKEKGKETEGTLSGATTVMGNGRESPKDAGLERGGREVGVPSWQGARERGGSLLRVSHPGSDGDAKTKGVGGG